MDSNARDFVDRLIESRLLTPSQRESLTIEAAEPRTGKQLATDLVRRRLLTRWQAEQLLFGRTTFQLGDYVLRRKVGGGATGAVYDVLHFQTAERRALKILSPKLAGDAAYVQRFRREVTFLKRLDHPAVVKCFMSDRVRDTEFLVMEYISGPDLGTWLESQRTVAPALAARMVEFVAAGLQHIHESGLVHRDIKPSNLMLFTDPDSRRPSLKIVDFGIAGHRLDDSTESNSRDFVLGSLDYIAPEQLENASSVDIRADIFSLGATLFEMLSGRQLTKADRLSEKLSERLSNAPPKIASVFPSCPRAFAGVVDRCLEPDPARRFGTPAEVADALRLARTSPGSEFHSTPPIVSQRPSPPHRSEAEDDELSGDSASDLDDVLPALVTRKPMTVNEQPPGAEATPVLPPRFRVLRLAIVASLISIVVAVLASQSGRASVRILWSVDDQTEGSRLVINEQSIPISRDGTTEVWLPPGTADFRLERMGFDTLKQGLEIGWGDRFTFTPEWTPTTLLAERRALRSLITRWNHQTTSTADHPDQRVLRSRVATALSRGVGRTLRGEYLGLMRAIPSEFDRRLEEEFSSRRGIEWTVGSRAFQHSETVTDVAFAPNGKVFATSGNDGVVQVYGMPDGGRLRTVSLAVAVRHIEFLNNNRLLIAAANGTLFAQEIDQDRRVDFNAPRAAPVSLSISNSRDHFAVGYSDNKLRVFRSNSLDPVKTIPLSHFVNTVAWSTDDRLVGGADARGITKVWDRSADMVHSLPKG
ncbi:MAG: serine/threonine-protein kinase, partial [Planctomycetota bacterium]